MKRFRIGNDIRIKWTVMKQGKNADLQGKKVLLYMTHAKGREAVAVFTLNNNVIEFTFEGLAQKVLGRYTLTIDVRTGEGKDEKRYLIQDKCGAFELVGRSCVEEPEETEYTIDL